MLIDDDTCLRSLVDFRLECFLGVYRGIICPLSLCALGSCNSLYVFLCISVADCIQLCGLNKFLVGICWTVDLLLRLRYWDLNVIFTSFCSLLSSLVFPCIAAPCISPLLTGSTHWLAAYFIIDSSLLSLVASIFCTAISVCWTAPGSYADFQSLVAQLRCTDICITPQLWSLVFVWIAVFHAGVLACQVVSLCVLVVFTPWANLVDVLCLKYWGWSNLTSMFTIST